MPTVIPALFAYPSHPDLLAETIERAIASLRDNLGRNSIEGWRETDIAGRFIGEQVLAKIDDRSALIADVTHLNFNVTYEIGFAQGRGFF